MSTNWIRVVIGALGMSVAAVIVAVLIWVGGPSKEHQLEPGDLATTSTGSQTDGIEVHGHWIIKVLDVDGTLVSHNEFDNDVDFETSFGLGRILTRQRTIGAWQISIGLSAITNIRIGPCGITDYEYGISCVITEPVNRLPNDHGVFYNLTVEPFGPFRGLPLQGPLILSGTAIAEEDSSIERVRAAIAICASSVSPLRCASSRGTGELPISGTLIEPIEVMTGHAIWVRVEISFS